jgi:hypothetical protein
MFLYGAMFWVAVSFVLSFVLSFVFSFGVVGEPHKVLSL